MSKLLNEEKTRKSLEGLLVMFFFVCFFHIIALTRSLWMTFILSLSKHMVVFSNRATPGARARNRNPQKREEPCWKPVQNPSAEKWNHGWNVSAEGKRLAAVSGPWQLINTFISFWRIICCLSTNMNMNKLYCFSIIQSNISWLKSCVFEVEKMCSWR